MGRLAVIPTPIGNMEDITLRAIRYLKEADLVLAEDTRNTKKLLVAYDIATPLKSYHMHNEHVVSESIVEYIGAGHEVALVTDAGMPGISDPGYMLVSACVEAEVEVVCLPGASAAVTALVGSGLPCDRFFFEGFLPPKKGRQARLSEIGEREVTSIIYESPRRLAKLLEQMLPFVGDDRPVVVARELSKIHEEYKRGTAKELADYYKENDALGEIVVMIAPALKEDKVHKNKYQHLITNEYEIN